MNRFRLRDMVVMALKNKTVAKDRVRVPEDTPTWDGEYPLIDVRFNRKPSDHKESIGPVGGGNFMTTSYICATGQIKASTAEEAENAIDVLAEQIEKAVISDLELNRHIRQFATVETHTEINAEGDAHLGGALVVFALQYEQFPDDFGYPEAVPLAGVDLKKPPPACETSQPQLIAAINLPQKDCP